MSRALPAVVLGVAPAKAGQEAWHPDSASGRRLAVLCDVHPEDLSKWLGLDNLCSSTDPEREELKSAGQAYQFLKGHRYLLAGSEVVRALGKRALVGGASWHAQRQPAPLEWYRSDEGVQLALLPHPSGRNRWYNSAERRRAAGEFVRACLLDGAGEVFQKKVLARSRRT